MQSTIRQTLKQAAARTMTHLHCCARYDRMILVLSHMRSATTAMSNVLCSHAAIAGYGETHVPHVNTSSPGQVAVNLMVRRALPSGTDYLFDKVLHNRLDSTAPAAFFQSKALFLVRQPGTSIASIVKLAQKTGMTEITSAEEAALYYAERLEQLQQFWEAFPSENRYGMTAERLLAAPDERVSEIGRWLQLDPPLTNSYVSHKATQVGGGGDPTRSAQHTRIEPRPFEDHVPTIENVSTSLKQRCQNAHDALVQQFESS